MSWDPTFFSPIAFKIDCFAFSGEDGLISCKSSISVIGLFVWEGQVKSDRTALSGQLFKYRVSCEINQNHSLLTSSVLL